jgi:hypothetical protein
LYHEICRISQWGNNNDQDVLDILRGASTSDSQDSYVIEMNSGLGDPTSSSLDKHHTLPKSTFVLWHTFNLFVERLRQEGV